MLNLSFSFNSEIRKSIFDSTNILAYLEKCAICGSATVRVCDCVFVFRDYMRAHSRTYCDTAAERTCENSCSEAVAAAL